MQADKLLETAHMLRQTFYSVSVLCLVPDSDFDHEIVVYASGSRATSLTAYVLRQAFYLASLCVLCLTS